MATEDEARDAADGTEVQVEAVDLGTVHFQEHPDVKLSSIMEIKNVGETIESTEGTLKIPEDQVLVEAPSEVELPPQHNLNGKASSLNGHMDNEEKVSDEQPHENDQEEAELDGTSAHQSNGINKQEVTGGLSYGESTTEDGTLQKHEKDEEPKGKDQQDLEGVTVDDDLVQEDTLKTDSAIEQTDDGSLLKHEKDEEPKGNDQKDLEGITVDDDSVQEDTLKTECAIEQTDDGQQDQNQEPEKANEGTQPASSANNADVEVVAEAPTVLQIPVEPNLDKDKPARADGVVHPDHNESFPEDTSIAESTEEVVKVEDQQSQQADATDADVVQEEVLKCEETNVQEEVPKSEHADEPATDAHEMLNQESTEETEGPVDENIEETEHQSNMAALEETIPEHDITMREPPVDIQVKNQESLEEIEDAEAVDPEAAMQQSSVAFVEAIPEDQHNLGTTVDDDTVQEDTLEAIERTKDGQQDQDAGPEKATETTQPASTASIPDVAVVAEAPSRVHTPVEINLENSDAIPDTTDGNTETDESAKADGVIHPDLKDGFSEDISVAEPTEELVKVEGQQSQQGDTIDEDMVKEEVPKSEHADAQELLNQESAEETENPVEINLENSDAIPDGTDGNTETEESTEADGVIHPDHKEGISEDTSIAEPTEEVVKVEDQQSQQAVVMDEDVVKKEVPKSEHADAEEFAEETETPAEINLENSDAIPDGTDRNTGTDESAKTDGVIHPDHKEGFSEDTSIAEPTEEVVNVEDQQSQQADAMDEDVVKEEVPKSEHADTQELLNQESAEETDGPVNEKTEETEHKGNMAAPEETAPEHDAQPRDPPVNIQMQNQESLEEIKEAEVEMQESSVTLEETIPEEYVATTEPCSEIQHVHHVEPEENNGPGDAKGEEITDKSNTENAVQDDILQSGPATDIQPVQELEQTESEGTGTYETVEASDETPAVVVNDLAQEDATETSEPQVTETEELKESEATEPQEFIEQGYVTSSKELSAEDDLAYEPHTDDFSQTLEQQSVEVKETISTPEENIVEDNVTSENLTCDSQEVDNAESTEEIKGNIAENIAEISDVVIVDKAVEQIGLPTEDVAETHMRELEPEETKNTEPAETEEPSDQRNVVLFNDSAQADDTLESEMKQTESATETTETEAAPQESNRVSEGPPPEDHMKESEKSCDAEQVSITESSEVIDGDKDIITGGISSQSNMVSAGESAQENNVPESKPTADIQPVQQPEREETKNTELVEVNETSHETNTTIFQIPTEEDNPATVELHESARELSNIEAIEVGTPHQSDAPESEEQATEEIASEPQMLEPGPAKEMNDAEATKPQNISQDNIISTAAESVPEEIATEDNTTTEPDVDQQPQDQESAGFKENEADKPQGIALSSTLSTTEQSTLEDTATAAEPSSDTQAENSEPAEVTEGTENVESTTALAEAAASEEHVETDITADISPVQEPDLEETKPAEPAGTEDIMTSDLPAPESDIASIETTYDIKQENELEVTKEINVIEAINQTENATSEDPTPTDNETTLEGHPAELNEETTGNETDSLMLVSGIKYEIQTSLELKDDACDSGETVLTTQESENLTDEDAVQSPGDDILETSNNTDQDKEEQKDGCEHNSMKGFQNEEIITHVQDRDISGELTKRGTEEASQALFGSNSQEAQDVTKKDDTTEGGEQTSDLNSQPDDVALQLQTCEASALSIARQDEVVRKVDLDQQRKEDEIESQKEELQTDEQKHEGKVDDFTIEPLVEHEDNQNGLIEGTEETDACEGEQTETVITEIIKHKEAPHVSEDSSPISTDMKVDNVTGTDEGTAEDADVKNNNKDEQESAERDDIVTKDSTDEQDETTDEITNEELQPDLASSGQEASDPAPSNDDILHNDPASITQNGESGEHIEDKECTDKVNDDVHAVQASEEEITAEIEENKEKQNEDNAIHHDESLTKPEEEEAPQLHSNEPCNVDANIDYKTTLRKEIIHGNASIKPREIEEIGESKGLDSTSEPFAESSIKKNLERDLSSHHKVEDEKLSMIEQNAVDIEAMQEKADASTSAINQTKQCQEEIITDVQLKVEGNSFDKIDETASHEKTETSTTEAVPINDNITDKASEADDGPSDGSLQTFNDTGRDLDVSSVITASKEESVNENLEDHKLALPAHTAQDENTLEQVPCIEKTEREMPSSEELLPTEPEENQIPSENNEEESQDENQIPNDKNEEDTQDTDIGDAQKEIEQDLPVSHFLMNLILGKKNSDVDENSEPGAERKQEKTTEDDSRVFISKQEESLGSLPTENKVDDNLTCEQEKHDIKCSEEAQEMVKEQSDEEFNKNTCDLEIAAYQGNPQDNISGELLSEEAASVSTKMANGDIEISNLKLDDRAVDTVCQEKTEASTKIENGSLENNINNLTNTKASGEDNPGEGQTGPLQSLPEDENADAVSEQMPLLTESGKIDAKDLCCDVESVQNLACAKEDEPTECSIIEATSTPDIQLECEEVEKKEEEQHASTATGQFSEEDIEGLKDNIQKSTSSEVTTDEQAPQITKPVSDTQKNLAHEKGLYEGSTCMDEKENSNFSIIGAENFQTAVEIQADGPNMEISQDKKDEVADNKTAMEPEKLADGPNMQINQDKKDEVAENKTAMDPEKLGESDFQEHQETDAGHKSPIVTDEGDQQFLDKKETMIKEQVVPGTVESHEQTMSIKSNEEQQLFDSKVQERDLNVVSPREASEAEENFVDGTKPEFSTDEEQSPKADPEEKTYDEKVKDVEGTKNFTDGAAMKTEAPGATQKTHKKHNLLSGVGSKVKHQLAKVKKAIVRKRGHTKPDSPK